MWTEAKQPMEKTKITACLVHDFLKNVFSFFFFAMFMTYFVWSAILLQWLLWGLATSTLVIQICRLCVCFSLSMYICLSTFATSIGLWMLCQNSWPPGAYVRVLRDWEVSICTYHPWPERFVLGVHVCHFPCAFVNADMHTCTHLHKHSHF